MIGSTPTWPAGESRPAGFLEGVALELKNPAAAWNPAAQHEGTKP